MNPEDTLSRSEVRQREKQERCKHPSLKCSLCGKYKDNLFNEYQAEIDILLVLLDFYEKVMDMHNIPHPSYYDLLNGGIISTYQKEMILRYISTRRNSEQQL